MSSGAVQAANMSRIPLIILILVPWISSQEETLSTLSLLYIDSDKITESPEVLVTSATQTSELIPSSSSDKNSTNSSSSSSTGVNHPHPTPDLSPIPVDNVFGISSFSASDAISESPVQRVPVTRTTVKPKVKRPPPTFATPTPTFPSPLGKDPIGVKFYLYTRFHSHSPYVLDPNSADSLKGAYFTFSYASGKKAVAKNRKLYLVIHGLSDGVEVTPWMKTVKTRILETDRDANVVLVDWSRGAAVNLLNDLRFASVRIVGQQAAQLIKGLEYLYPESFSGDNVHLIAHSFGTFAADVVGRNIQGLGRITGLDPAGGVSNIASLPPSQRLDPSDAKFVDVIHTDAPKPADAPIGLNPSPLPQFVLPGSSLLRTPAVAAVAGSASGTLLQMGHYDFYPNGGYAQPGCNVLSTSPAASILRPLLPAVTLGSSQTNTLKKMLSCSHTRAIDLFIESIKSREAPGCSLVSYACSNYTNFLEAKCTLCREGDTTSSESCALMGFHSADSFDASSHGGNKKFFVTTNNRAPYCLYHYGVAVKIAKKPKTQSRGGVLLINLEGEYLSSSQEPNLEVKLLGGLNGFKAGKTVRAIFTHFADVGAIKTATVSWVPAPPNLGTLLSPSTSPSLYVQALKVYPMSFAEAPTRKAITRALCPPPTPASGFLGESYVSRNEPPVAALSAFFKEINFSTSRCTHHNTHHHHHFRDVDADTQHEKYWAENSNENDDDSPTPSPNLKEIS